MFGGILFHTVFHERLAAFISTSNWLIEEMNLRSIHTTIFSILSSWRDRYGPSFNLDPHSQVSFTNSSVSAITFNNKRGVSVRVKTDVLVKLTLTFRSYFLESGAWSWPEAIIDGSFHRRVPARYKQIGDNRSKENLGTRRIIWIRRLCGSWAPSTFEW